MFRSVEWALLDTAAISPVAVGDLVSVDAGGMPIYRVTKVAGPSVWVAGERDAAEREMPLGLFRWRGVARVAHAA
jgi:hypothetical protein